MIKLLNRSFTCPRWHRPLLFVVPGGIEIKCKACGEKHIVGRAHLEQAWRDLEIATRETKPLRVVRA